MKKIFTLIALTFSLTAGAQSLEAWIWDTPSSSTVSVISNGGQIPYTTTVSSTTEVVIKFKNNSANNNTYSVLRKDLVLNPGAKAHFCFGDLGTCYDETTYEISSDFCTLAAGQETSGGKNLITEMDEAATVGYSVIYYKIFDAATGKNGPDTLSFTLKYNQLLGIKENNSVIAYNSDIYPNPSSDKASVTVVMAHDNSVKLQVHNSLGAIVYSRSEYVPAGKNKLSIDCSNYPDGLYFVTLSSGDSNITKRLIINK